MNIYILGAPMSPAGREAYKTKLIQRFKRHFMLLRKRDLFDQQVPSELFEQSIESEALEAVVENVQTILNRITDKSSGLLQATAMAAAGFSFLDMQLAAETRWTVASCLFAIAVLLVWNLRMVWYRNPSTYENARSDIDRVLSLAANRGLRLTIAIWFALVAVAATAAASLPSLSDYMAALAISGTDQLIEALTGLLAR